MVARRQASAPAPIATYFAQNLMRQLAELLAAAAVTGRLAPTEPERRQRDWWQNVIHAVAAGASGPAL
jgi:hypothetical protein